MLRKEIVVVTRRRDSALYVRAICYAGGRQFRLGLILVGSHSSPMTNGKALRLNTIVKNEMANLERCLGAVADHIAYLVIGDTGSIDGTRDFIPLFFGTRNLLGELHSFPFKNFDRARTEVLAPSSGECQLR